MSVSPEMPLRWGRRTWSRFRDPSLHVHCSDVEDVLMGAVVLWCGLCWGLATRWNAV